MAEIVDFGLQQHKIKMDSRYFENVLSVVAGDTGRRLEVQLLDTNGMVQNTIGLNLRLNALVAGKATFTDATLVDAANGKYQLDLSNGMFLAPGNWQFQWQITDSAGKKLHSFAFTGNIGKNISEGGSQATNFYLNLEDLKAMQEDLVNGTIDSSILETNITEKLTNLETQYAPKLTEVTAQLAQTAKHVRESYNNGLSAIDLRQYNYFTEFEITSDKAVLTKTKIDVLTQKAGVLVEIGIFDDTFNKILSSDKQEIINVGKNEFAFPYFELSSGTYYFGITSSNSTEDVSVRGDSKAGYITTKKYPLESTSSVYEYHTSPFFEIYSYDLPTPIGFQFQNNTKYRIFCKSNLNGAVYGWNTTTGRIAVSYDSGSVFSDLMLIPEGVWSMVVDDTNNRLYMGTASGKIYGTSGLTATDAFTNITPPLKNVNATLLPQGLSIWKGWLWYGEYSASPNDLVGGCSVHKYNLATKQWLISKTFVNGRHVHNFANQGTSALFTTIGDAGWGDQVGIHRLTTISTTGEDTWTMWSGLNGVFTNHYPVDNVQTTLEGESVLLGAGDRPKIHLTLTKLTNTRAGGANINARNYGFKDSGVGETVRNVILDDEKNCYYVTAETNKQRLCVSPYPWTQSYILQELSGYSVLTTPITKSGDWIMFHTFRFHTVSFGEKKKITITERAKLYDNGEVYAFTSGTSGVNTSSAIKNSKSLFVESLCNTALSSQKTGFYTEQKIDLTVYKSVFVEGEFLSNAGVNMLRIKIDTTTAIDGNVKESIVVNQDNYVNQTFSQKLDISTISGLHYVHVQSIASGLGSKATIKINKIFLSEV